MFHAEIVPNCGYAGFNPVQLGQEDCAPGYGYGPAVRTHWLLHYVTSGCGTFTREGVTYPVGAGQIFVIPPYLETYYAADTGNPWHYIWIGFTADGALPEVFSQPVLLCPEAGSLFREMLSCRQLKSGKSAYLAGCLWQLTSLLLEQGQSKGDYVDMALAYIHAEYMHPISVQELAQRLGLNRSYFYSLFLERTGLPPSQYLIRLRLGKAAELMAKLGESPSVAAASVGYEDIFHFSKLFKKHYGISPRAYAKKFANTAQMSAPERE